MVDQITIDSPEFARAWQHLTDHLLNEIAAGEDEGREALGIIYNAIDHHAQARTAEDERRDVLARLGDSAKWYEKHAEEFLCASGELRAQAVALQHEIDTITRGDHIGYHKAVNL